MVSEQAAWPGVQAAEACPGPGAHHKLQALLGGHRCCRVGGSYRGTQLEGRQCLLDCGGLCAAAGLACTQPELREGCPMRLRCQQPGLHTEPVHVQWGWLLLLHSCLVRLSGAASRSSCQASGGVSLPLLTPQ